MTNEELWVLFPIILSEHRAEWTKFYEQEKDTIISALGTKNISRINHIGSTSVPGLIAKPTIDILLEIPTDADIPSLTTALISAGYICNMQPNNPAPHLMFMKGYTPQGFRGQAVHLHVRFPGDWDELYFRDYLRSHPKTAKSYGKLKKTFNSAMNMIGMPTPRPKPTLSKRPLVWPERKWATNTLHRQRLYKQRDSVKYHL